MYFFCGHSLNAHERTGEILFAALSLQHHQLHALRFSSRRGLYAYILIHECVTGKKGKARINKGIYKSKYFYFIQTQYVADIFYQYKKYNIEEILLLK